MSGRRRVSIELTRSCDGACRFCGQAVMARDDRPEPEIVAAIDAAAQLGSEISFVGGEPTGHPQLAAWIERARKRGATAVGLQTHGRAFADANLVETLRAAGLTDVHLSIHGARAAVHDYHTQRDGSLAATLTGLSHLRAARLLVVVATVVTRSNFRVLAELPERLLAWGVSAWSLNWVMATGDAAAAFDRLAPRIGMAAPFVLHAVASARRLGLAAYTTGLPRCALGPMTAVALASAARTYAQTCVACPARMQCPGVDHQYLERFGDEELRHCEAGAAPQYEPRQLAAQRMFVGLGRHAHPIVPTTPEPPSRARSRLVVLGRPDPARQEVRKHQPADGDALRGIFPDLFDAATTPDDDEER